MYLYFVTTVTENASLLLLPDQELIDDFIFPASNVYLQYMKSGEFPTEQAIPVCSTPASINAGFELLVALAVGCVRNLKQIVDTLTDMYYLGRRALLPFPPPGHRQCEEESSLVVSLPQAARRSPSGSTCPPWGRGPTRASSA